MKKQTTKTRKVAGHSITLETGRRYYAHRPVYTGRERTFTVTITDITDGGTAFSGATAATFPGLSYDAANRLLNGFNHGRLSFDGRVW